MRELIGVGVIGAFSIASGALAQTATSTVDLGDFAIQGFDGSVEISTAGLPTGEVYAAWRLITDFSQLNDTSFPVSNLVRVSFQGPSGTLISPRIGPVNGFNNPGRDVLGLTHLGFFNTDPASFASVDMVIEQGGATPSVSGVYENATLEFFTLSDIPESPIQSAPLVPTAPDIEFDLGFVAVDGDAISFATDDSGGAWSDRSSSSTRATARWSISGSSEVRSPSPVWLAPRRRSPRTTARSVSSVSDRASTR